MDRHTVANAPLQNSGLDTRAWSWCTRPSMRAGSIRSSCTFSIIQRKVLTPNDLDSLTDLIERIRAFGERYSALGKPFSWTFTRQDLERRLHDPLLHLESAPSLHTAA